MKTFWHDFRTLWRLPELRTFLILTFPFALLGYVVTKAFEPVFGWFNSKRGQDDKRRV